MTSFARTLALIAIVPLLGCVVVEDQIRDTEGTGQGPGNQPWNHDENVTCSVEADCAAGETCEDGVCQMKRCLEVSSSKPPMGVNRYFGTDGELAVISDDSWIDGFEATDGKYLNSWDLKQSGDKIVDVAGGDLTGKRPHTIAVALEFSDTLKLNGPDGVEELNVGMWPVALATGDVDADGIDELVAFAEDGSIAVCDVDVKKCSKASIEGAKGKDVAVADVDGDGFAEPILLFELTGKTQIVVWNVDAEKTGQEQTLGWELSFPARAMSAGDVTGDGLGEIALLEDGGWWGWKDDKVHVFSPAKDAILYSKGVNGHTLDVAIGDRDSDEVKEIVILREDHKLELLKVSQNELKSLSTFDITVGEKAQRVSVLDWNGDSASGRLVSGPELIAGKAVPIAALMFPPYPRNAASAALAANITLGNNESQSDSLSDTLTLSVGMAVSFGGDYGIFKAKVGAYFNKDFSYTHTVSKSQTVGQRFWIVADPDLHGVDYAPVVTSCGCYDLYRYQTEDPSGLIGGSGQTVDIYVPVGGQTLLWSSKRYNAMAKALGTLPVIEVPVRVGDLDSYPQALQTLDGQPIPQQDLLFPNTPSFQVSDVGFVSFWLVKGEQQTNATAESTTLGIQGSLGIGPVSVDSNIGLGVTQGYSISVGTDTIFSGGVPPIPDNPETPEDEFALYRYTFTPTVYRQHYLDPVGEDAAYYVLTYAVGK